MWCGLCYVASDKILNTGQNVENGIVCFQSKSGWPNQCELENILDVLVRRGEVVRWGPGPVVTSLLSHILKSPLPREKLGRSSHN